MEKNILFLYKAVFYCDQIVTGFQEEPLKVRWMQLNKNRNNIDHLQSSF